MRIPYITLAAASALALSGCAYGDLGMGLGYGDPYYDYGYGYGSPYGYGYGPYGGYGAYPGYYGGFGAPFGWYGDYYYPGSGIYVYDSYRRPRVWTSTERTYWTSRRPKTTTVTTTATPNWSDFTHRTTSTVYNSPTYEQRLAARQERMQAREQRQQDRADRWTTTTDRPRHRRD